MSDKKVMSSNKKNLYVGLSTTNKMIYCFSSIAYLSYPTCCLQRFIAALIQLQPKNRDRSGVVILLSTLYTQRNKLHLDLPLYLRR